MIAIRNMKMPNNCIYCPMYVGQIGEGHCAITHKWNAVGGLKRLDDCPLVEIDKCQEGDYISKQALYDELYTRFHEDDAPNNITYVPLGRVRNFVKNFPPLGLISDKESVEKE